MSKPEADGGAAIESTPLLACPFCGSLDLWYYPDATAVGCRGCFMTGPIIEGSDRAIDVADQGGDEDAAVMLWNTRRANAALTGGEAVPSNGVVGVEIGENDESKN